MASASSQLAQIGPLKEASSLLPKMENELRFTPIKTIHEDGTFDITMIEDPYYLENNKWDVWHFLRLEQFANQQTARWATAQSYHYTFSFDEPNLNLESKYIVHKLIFSDEWSLSATFTLRRAAMGRLAKFVNEFHPEIKSYSEMQSQTFILEYASYLTDEGLTTYYLEGEKKKKKSENFAIPSVMYNHLQRILRNEYFSDLSTDLWQEDVWDIKYFSRFGIDAPSTSAKSIVFTEIEFPIFKALVKKYLKEKLLTRSIKWGTAHSRSIYLKRFLNYIHQKYPTWKDLHNLSRKDMLEYYEMLCLYANGELKAKRTDANPKHYPKSMMSQIRTFLDDLQMMEYPEAPKISAFQLIHRDDTKG